MRQPLKSPETASLLIDLVTDFKFEDDNKIAAADNRHPLPVISAARGAIITPSPVPMSAD